MFLIIVAIVCFRKWDHKWQNLLLLLLRPYGFRKWDHKWQNLLLFLLKFDTLRALEQLRSWPNDTYIPQIHVVKMQYLHK